MIARHYALPHRFVCATDDTEGLDGIETFPLWPTWAEVPSPHGPGSPSCYRRIKAFAPEAREWFGERIVSIDLDAVIVGDIVPLFDRGEEFIAWRDPMHPRQMNGSLWMLTAGARSRVASSFDPASSPQSALLAGFRGSDQAWISYCLPECAAWRQADGVYSYKSAKLGKEPLPANAKVVFFHGEPKPWDSGPQSLEWVREHYR